MVRSAPPAAVPRLADAFDLRLAHWLLYLLRGAGALEFLTMPFLGGGDLQGALAPLAGSARGALLVRALLDVCRGLFFVHQRGVVHGAVTPANILFSPETRRFKLASEFYRWLFSGATVSRAALEARRSCATRFGEEDLTWARYVLFGHPFDRIELAVRS